MTEPPTERGIPPYQVTAEFYDLLHGVDYRRRARRLLSACAARAKVAILEIGAGTGLVTAVLAEASSVPVHAVEPALPMRALLLSRLANASRLIRHRVTVHAESMEDIYLSEMADLAVCINVASCWNPVQRRAVWRAIARALIPNGALILECPLEWADIHGQPAQPNAVTVGSDEYIVRMRMTGHCADRARMHISYQVQRDGILLREASESFDVSLLGRRTLLAELAKAGLYPEPADDSGRGNPTVLKVYRRA